MNDFRRLLNLVQEMSEPESSATSNQSDVELDEAKRKKRKKRRKTSRSSSSSRPVYYGGGYGVLFRPPCVTCGGSGCGCGNGEGGGEGGGEG